MKKVWMCVIAFLYVGVVLYLFGYGVSAYANSDEIPSALVLGRYGVYESDYWIAFNKTVQEFSDEGFDVDGEPDWLLQVNYTRLNYFLSSKVIEISWPNATLELSEGEHDLNVTAYRILDNGSIGERMGSFLRLNQLEQTRTIEVSNPKFALLINPSALFIGNNFSTPISNSTVMIKELIPTPWGQNQSYMIYTEGKTETISFSTYGWWEEKTGISLKEIVATESLTFISHEEIRIVEVGIEAEDENGDVTQEFPYLIVGLLAVIGIALVVVTYLRVRR